MLQILKKVKQEYLENSSSDIKENFFLFSIHPGLCSAADECLNTKEYFKFRDYLKNNIKNRKRFFTIENYPTKSSTQFVWKIGNVQSRINWLEKHIKKNTNFETKR